jgi:hypothetical protein
MLNYFNQTEPNVTELGQKQLAGSDVDIMVQSGSVIVNCYHFESIDDNQANWVQWGSIRVD